MLTVVAAVGAAPVPGDLWASWHLHPLPLLILAAVAWAWLRGTAGAPGEADLARAWCFAAALAAAAVAVVSPLDALARALASAHMVQHVLLVLVVAPLVALAAPGGACGRGCPAGLRRALARLRDRWPRAAGAVRAVARPVPAWLLAVGALWFWHASVPYEAALASEPLHALEHAALLGTGILFWRTVIGPPHPFRLPGGAGVGMVFTMALQSVFLSALLTFASAPWYPSYASTAPAWGLDPLTDQQLAGLIMWVPAGLIYLGAALALLTSWVRASEHDAPAGVTAG